MYSLLLLALLSFLLSLIITPFVRNAAVRFNWVDHPDTLRKLHVCPVPRVGGVAVMLAYVLSFVILLLLPLNAVSLVLEGMPLTLRLAPALGLVFLVGLLDDIWHLKPWQKLLGQVVAALIAYWAGVRIFSSQSDAWMWNLPATVFWLIACTNAFNLIDGVDGLASGIGLFATLTTLTGGLLSHNSPLCLATAPLAGCLLGFLRYNFNPASIFLGDCGSLLIGFLLGCFGVLWSQKSATMLGLTAPIMAMAIPLLDTLLAVVRRFLRHQPIFGADRNHIHHRLLDHGLTPRRVALLLYGACGLAASLSLLLSLHGENYAGIIIILFCGVTWIGVQHLGYVEFNVAGELVMSGAFRRFLKAHISLRSFGQALGAAQTPAKCWEVLQSSYHEFGFSRLEMQLHGEFFHEGSRDGEFARSWTMCIPLSEADYLLLERDFTCDVMPTALPAFVEIVHQTLSDRLSVFRAEAQAARPQTAALT